MSDNETVRVLEAIHSLLAAEMLRKLESGEAKASDWSVIVKFLQQNGIDAYPKDGDAADAFAALVQKATASISQYQ